MAYDMLQHCPDYIKDFAEIQNLAYAQGMIYTSAQLRASTMRSVSTFYSKSDMWENLLGIDYSDDWLERTYRMLRRYEYISLEEYNNLVECFLEDEFELTVDYENLNVVIRTAKRIYNIDKYTDALRDIFPCNMTFAIEYVTEL